MTETSAPKHDVVVDLTGLTCPGPILEAKKIADGLEPGQVLLLLSDCPGTRDDLFAWARQTHNQVVHTERREGATVAYFLRKGRSRERKAQVVLDMRGVSCPGPIVEAKRLLDALKAGEVLMLASNCPGVRDDIAGWTKATGVRLLDTVEVAAGEFEFYLSRG